MSLSLYNTLTRKKEEFKPLDPPKVGLYTCGPTVYYYPHIGNWRTFVFEDILRRALQFNGFEVTHVMNVTDVGHLTGDNVGNADLGEDRMEKAAKKEGKTAWDVAEFYTIDFAKSRSELGILTPTHFVRATDHINEQIELIKKLEEKGFTYTTKLGVYFDVAKFPDYGELGGQKLVDKRVATREELKEDSDKKNQFDFALWKFSGPGELRQMEWESPWGVGFPGWHLECSAMSMKYLGDSFDIHTGGVDHIAIHHTNEIAQSEAATGKPFSKYWMHGEFLKVDGGRMGKSLGNAYSLHDIKDKGFDPLALRYLYLTANYRDILNFTLDSLTGAQTALGKLRDLVLAAKIQKERSVLSKEKDTQREEFSSRFSEAINDDLGTAKALAVLWEAVKSNIPSEDKFDLALSFDEVLGLGLSQLSEVEMVVPEGIKKLAEERVKLRKDGKFEESDKIRAKLDSLGYKIVDSSQGSLVKNK